MDEQLDPTRQVDSSDHEVSQSVADATVTRDDVGMSSVASSAPVSTGRYILGEEIARGGMGIVCRATDTVLNREVALKLLLGNHGPDSGAVRRFADEARISARLQHPSIPPIHDLCILPDGRPFLAMKLIRGDTLDKLLAGRPEPSAERSRFVAVFEQICQAIAYTHSHGIIHRDLKPANVMVGAFGEVQVMDWGLAKDLAKSPSAPGIPTRAMERLDDGDPAQTTDHRPSNESTEDRTQAGDVMGTPAYMPPEQALGEVERIDRRSDVFSLGGILCAILTGKPPYVGHTGAVLKRAAIGEVSEAWARLDSSGADAELVALCKRCMSKVATERPADGNEVAQLVAEYRVGVEQRLRAAERERAAADARSSEHRKKRRVQLALGAAVAAMLVSGVGVIWWQNRLAGERRAEQSRTEEQIETLLDRCEVAIVQEDDAVAAEFALSAAEKRAQSFGSEHLRDRLARCRTAVEVLAELDRIDAAKYAEAWRDRASGNALAKRKWSEVFTRIGAEIGRTPVVEAAQAVNGSPVRERLLTVLDAWLLLAHGEERNALAALLAAVDPDPFRDAVREALRKSDWPATVSLASQKEALAQPARFAVALGSVEAVPVSRRMEVLIAAVRTRPRAFGVLMQAGDNFEYNDAGTAADRIGWYRGAVILRPTDAIARFKLGLAFQDRKDYGEAIAEYREAIRLDSEFGLAHGNLGNALYAIGDQDGALEEYREATRIEPYLAFAHCGIGNIFHNRRNLDGAIAAYRAALDIHGDNAGYHGFLADVLYAKQNYDGALLSYREAIRLSPEHADAHHGVGCVLEIRSDLNGALESYRNALRFSPKNQLSRSSLARIEALRDRVLDVVAGRIEPDSPVEACKLAYLSLQASMGRFAGASRLYEKAFLADPKLTEDTVAQHRYAAACAATRAARGDGVDAPNRPVDRVTLRGEALGWLNADLKLYKKHVASDGAAGRDFAAYWLSYWLDDNDLKGTRPGDERKDWTPQERADWDALWKDVQALLIEAKKPVPEKAK